MITGSGTETSSPSTGNLNKDLLIKVFPFATSSYIDVSDYYILNKTPIKTLDFKINLICNKNFKENDSYNLIKTLFSNFTFFIVSSSSTLTI